MNGHYSGRAQLLTISTFAFSGLAVWAQSGMLGHTFSDAWHELIQFQDNSDTQYAGFRNNIPYLALLVAIHPLLRRVYERLRPAVTTGSTNSGPSGQAAAESRLRGRLAFDFGSALVYVTALSGFSILKILAIVLINFKIATALPRNVVPVATWIFNIGILFTNEFGQGYRYSAMSNAIIPFVPAAAGWGKFLDSYGGLMPRWEVLFKLTVLRMIAFNFDYLWSLDQSRAGSPVEVCELSDMLNSTRSRQIVNMSH
jgi:protein-cysteine N-palmitoyltransferase HHAT